MVELVVQRLMSLDEKVCGKVAICDIYGGLGSQGLAELLVQRLLSLEKVCGKGGICENIVAIWCSRGGLGCRVWSKDVDESGSAGMAKGCVRKMQSLTRRGNQVERRCLTAGEGAGEP